MTGPSNSARPPKAALRECIAGLHLPPGLLSAVYSRYQACDSRLWLIDNSSLMKVTDSHVGRGSTRSNGTSIIERVDNVSRWEESRDTIAFHTKMASKCWIPTKFWLVNQPIGPGIPPDESQKFGLCWSTPDDVPDEMKHIRFIMKNIQLNQTKCELTSRIESLTRSIAKEASSLSARHKRVTVVICTQGLPTNSKGQTGNTIRREFQAALWNLSQLPVKVIVRLTTDDERVRDLFNDMGGNFDCVDVLDDYWGEAMEVYLHNPWLTYSMGLHRLRESGYAPEVLDNLDERPLSLDEIHQFCTLLFLGEDGSNGTLPLPPYQPTSPAQLKRSSWINNWIPFTYQMDNLIAREEMQWNPIKKRQTPWIDIKKLEATLRDQIGDTSADYQQFNGAGARPAFNGASPSFRSGGYPGGAQPRRGSDPRAARAPRDPPKRSTSEHWQRNAAQEPEEQRSMPKRSNSCGGEQWQRNAAQGDSPPSRRAQSSRPASTSADRGSTGQNSNAALEQVLKQWSHQPPDYKKPSPLANLLVNVPKLLFPPENSTVEAHYYFAKWKKLDKEAFADESDDVLKELLKRAVRQAKFFLHPDRLPKDLTENQSELFKQTWHVIAEQEEKTNLG